VKILSVFQIEENSQTEKHQIIRKIGKGHNFVDEEIIKFKSPLDGRLISENQQIYFLEKGINEIREKNFIQIRGCYKKIEKGRERIPIPEKAYKYRFVRIFNQQENHDPDHEKGKKMELRI